MIKRRWYVRNDGSWDWPAFWSDEWADTKMKVRVLVIGLTLVVLWACAVELLACFQGGHS